MCGIVGFNHEDPDLLRSALTALAHRGPDDSGIFTDRRMSLGHQRLSIIDLSKRGHQPMADDNVVIVFNGEIYNYKELKQQLPGNYFSDSDTEVLLKSYLKYGVACLQHLNGIFAFCIYDRNERKLFLARDHIGVKPLYYYYDGKSFFFASEIKAILQDSTIPREIDNESLNNYFTYFYIPAPKTIWKNIYKLPAGHYAVFDLKTRQLSLHPYYQIAFHPEQAAEQYFITKLQEEFQNTVKRQLVADVPVGAYLSGGMDSSAIVAVMSKLMENVNTFSVGFDTDTVVNELAYAKQVAAACNTIHHELTVTAEQAISILPKIAYHLDEPIANPAAIPLYFMAKEAKKKMTVVLTGNGGDELFAGYQQHEVISRLHHLQNYSRLVNNPLSRKLLNALHHAAPSKYTRFATQLLPHLHDIPAAYRALLYDKNISAAERRSLLQHYQPATDYTTPYFQSNDHIINQLAMIDLRMLLPEDYLMVDDKINMAHAVESRVPFLDRSMIAYASRIPPELKLKGRIRKYVLKKAMQGMLPPAVLTRKKYGFTPPLRHWLHAGMRSRAIELYWNSELRALFRTETLSTIWDAPLHDNKVFPLLMFAEWYHQYL